jgi:hypothetical protein
MYTQSHNTAITELEIDQRTEFLSSRDTKIKDTWQPVPLKNSYTSTSYGRHVELLYHFLKEG